ncbi:MAG TPA: hypothetical protein VMT59_05050 [Gaiellaceae bacterium]|nr:hypothetical protein [Gaiellaceae bacterium]
MNEKELQIHLERGLAHLQREFADTVPAEHVTRIGKDRFERLFENAKIWDFIPLLVYRQTREALLAFKPEEHEPAASTPTRRIEVDTRSLESVHG